MTNRKSSLNKNKTTTISEFSPTLHLSHLPLSNLVTEKYTLIQVYQLQIYETQRNRKYALYK